MRRSIAVKLLCTLLVLSGITMVSSGGYIHAKALLGQYLIEQSWRQTAATGRPAKPWFWMDSWPVNKLIVKRLGIEQIILAGDSGQALAFGPGHRTASARPGEPGVTLISGHRDTHFQFVEQLKKGDQLIIEKPNGQQLKYRVSQLTVVEADARLQQDETGQLLVLATCWPFQSRSLDPGYRYLVIAKPEVLTGLTRA